MLVCPSLGFQTKIPYNVDHVEGAGEKVRDIDEFELIGFPVACMNKLDEKNK